MNRPARSARESRALRPDRPRRERRLAARPDRVLLHVGHGKTGSSFLQAALANSPEALAAHGLGYPIDPEVAENARRGGISSGNMAPSARALQSALEQGWEGPQDTLLISSESFFYKMRLKGFPEKLRQLLPDAEVQVLLYVRDPLEHAVSKYQQGVKRGGFEAFLASYNTPGNVAQFLKWLDGALPRGAGHPAQLLAPPRRLDGDLRGLARPARGNVGGAAGGAGEPLDDQCRDHDAARLQPASRRQDRLSR